MNQFVSLKGCHHEEGIVHPAGEVARQNGVTITRQEPLRPYSTMRNLKLTSFSLVDGPTDHLAHGLALSARSMSFTRWKAECPSRS